MYLVFYNMSINLVIKYSPSLGTALLFTLWLDNTEASKTYRTLYLIYKLQLPDGSVRPLSEEPRRHTLHCHLPALRTGCLSPHLH